MIETKDALRSRYIIRGDSTWKSTWDWTIVAFVIYNSILIPWEFSFQTDVNLALQIVDHAIDFAFLVGLAPIPGDSPFVKAVGSTSMRSRRIRLVQANAGPLVILRLWVL